MRWFSHNSDSGSDAKSACTDKRVGKSRAATSGPWSGTDIDESNGEFEDTNMRWDILSSLRGKS